MRGFGTYLRMMKLAVLGLFCGMLGITGVRAESLVDSIAGKRTVFLGDSITQAGAYVSYTSYYLQRLHPEKDFDHYSLGLSSETVSGLSEKGHAGGRFPRPVVFERLGRMLEKVKPEVVFACYGINCGIYQPLDEKRFGAFKEGVKKLIKECREGGVEQVFIVTPPIYDTTVKEGAFNYDDVMTAYAAWEMTLQEDGVRVIDLHSAMRKARDAQGKAFARDRVHPGAEGHLVMARAILEGLEVKLPSESADVVGKDPLFMKVDQLRKLRSQAWMKHIGYTRSKKVEPSGLGDTAAKVAEIQKEIDTLRRKK